MACPISSPSARPFASTPTKVSPAPVVSTGTIGRAAAWIRDPSGAMAKAPRDPAVTMQVAPKERAMAVPAFR